MRCASQSVWMFGTSFMVPKINERLWTVNRCMQAKTIIRQHSEWIKKKNILFFGTGEFALPTLAILNNRKDVANLEVVTPTKKMQGRKVHSFIPPIVEYSVKNDLKIHEIGEDNMKLEKLSNIASNFDLGIVVSFGYFLPPNLIKKFRSGAINIHPSVLPLYRGAAPIEWAILNGDKKIGISIIDVDPHSFDTGSIYKQKIYTLDMNDTRNGVTQKLANEGSLMIDHLLRKSSWDINNQNKLSFNDISLVSQNMSIKKNYKGARKLFKQNDAMIPWETIQSSECLYNRWRALNENIGCWANGVARQYCIYNEKDRNVKRNDVALKFVSLEAPVKMLLDRNGGDDYTYSQDKTILHVEKRFEMHYSKLLSRLLIHLNDSQASCKKNVYIPCNQIQLKGRNTMKANAFANGHMKKNAAYFSLQHQRSTIRKQSTACISYVEKSTPKKDQLHHVINEFGMNICNAIGQWKIENVLNMKDPKHLKVGIGLSGGPDSTALLFLLHKLFSSDNIASYDNLFRNIRHDSIMVVVVDHGLRSESAFEAEYACKLYESHKTIKTMLVTLKKTDNDFEHESSSNCRGKGIQNWGRKRRYNEMQKVCKQNKIDILMTGHHADDQIETTLMRIFRGSGNNGLRGINQGIQWNSEILILRPLLTFDKSLLRDICINNNLNFVFDPSNDNNLFDRVRTRKAIQAYHSVEKTKCENTRRKQHFKDNIDKSVKSIASFMSIQKVHVDNRISAIMKEALGVYNPRLGYVTVCTRVTGEENDRFLQMRMVKTLIQNVNNCLYSSVDKQCKQLIERINNKMMTESTKKRLEVSVNIKKCIVDIKYENVSYLDGRICISRSPPVYEREVRLIDNKKNIVTDSCHNINILSLKGDGDKDSTRIFWDNRYVIYLSNNNTILTVEHKSERILKYELCKDRLYDMKYGIGFLPKGLNLKKKRKLLNKIEKIDPNGQSEAQASTSYSKIKANNYVKQCFGLYCKVVESSKDDGRHYWKLIGIPQLNICNAIYY